MTVRHIIIIFSLCLLVSPAYAENLECLQSTPGNKASVLGSVYAYNFGNLVQQDSDSDPHLAIGSGAFFDTYVGDRTTHLRVGEWLAEATCDTTYGTPSFFPQHNAATEAFIESISADGLGGGPGGVIIDTDATSLSSYVIQPSVLNPTRTACTIFGTISIIGSANGVGNVSGDDTMVVAQAGRIRIHAYLMNNNSWSVYILDVVTEEYIDNFISNGLNLIVDIEQPASVGEDFLLLSACYYQRICEEEGAELFTGSAHASATVELVPPSESPLTAPRVTIRDPDDDDE